MKTALIQPVVKDNAGENLEQVLQLLDQAAAEGADLAILPELWSVPFINDQIAAASDHFDTMIPALQNAAARHSMWIVTGTMPRKHQGKVYNSAAVIDDQGNVQAIADKLHLLEVHTRWNSYYESDVFDPGTAPCIVETPWGRLGVLICYDLRFPELSRMMAEDCFMLAVCAGFNAAVGQKHWQPLNQTRAMENEVFIAGVNPAAADYATYSSWGHSLIASPDGQILNTPDPDRQVEVIEIDPEQVKKVRARSPYWKLRRSDIYDLEPSAMLTKTGKC